MSPSPWELWGWQGRPGVPWGAGHVAQSAISTGLKPPPASLLFLALSLGIGFQAGAAGERSVAGGSELFSGLTPCALLLLVATHGSGPSPALPRGLGVHAKGAPCQSKGCAPESLPFPVSLALHCQLF